MWLHEICGYTFFNIPDLTYPEINKLVSSKNRMIKREEKENKKASRKAKNSGRYRR